MPTTSVDHHRTSADQTIKAHRGSGHAARFGVKPNSGKVADIWVGAPEITPSDYLSEAEHAAVHGREYRLVEAARALAAVTHGPSRREILATCKRECVALAEFDGQAATVAAAVSKALGF